MADTTHSPSALRDILGRIDRVWAALVLILLAVAVLDTAQLMPTISFATGALGRTSPFIIFAVLAIGYLKASGAENVIAGAFEGRETQMIILAALAGGLSPFCSCQVIPFIAALLAVGTPLSAVMAFWISSPLMDPAMFAITSGTLGFDFAIAKTVAAVLMGLFGGFATMLFAHTPVFQDPLKTKPKVGGCCGVKKPFSEAPLWAFWKEPARRETFRSETLSNALFLVKWLAIAYVIEAIMIEYVPAEWIANVLGGAGIGTVMLGAVVGGASLSERLCRGTAGGCFVGTGHGEWGGDELHAGRWRQFYPGNDCGLGTGQTASVRRLSWLCHDRSLHSRDDLAGDRLTAMIFPED